MKVWTELDMEQVLKSINTKMRGQELKSPNEMTDEWWHLLDVRTTIEKNAHESDDLTIYGYRVGDLVPLASVLRAKGVSPKEIEDWHKDLQGLLDFVAEQEMEAHQKAFADLLKGFEGPDKETGEWFVKAIGRKGAED